MSQEDAMSRTLQDLKNEAEERLSKQQFLDSMKVFRLVLEGAPLDFELRLQIGDVLVALKRKEHALAVYKGIAEHTILAGNPFLAMSAIKRIQVLGGDVQALSDKLTQTYSAGSSVIGRGIKQAPMDYSLKVRDDIDVDYAVDEEKLINETAQMTAFIGNIEKYPSMVPAVPIFSTLEKDGFLKLLDKLKLKQFVQDDVIIKQGHAGSAVYFICRGEVTVVRTEKDADGVEHQTALARLGPGSLFGEMALVSSDPRSASVVCDNYVDVLELARESVEELSSNIAQVAGAMARFTKERMINNLLVTNPLFTPFDKEMGKKLLARFTGHEVPEGTIFLEQGTAGNGLYVILQGQAEVLRYDKGEYVKIADLGPGDVAGEISLLHEEPISATVRTTTPATLLFLARELFQPLLESVPELLVHFNKLANQRLSDTEFKMMQQTVLDDDFIEELEDTELSDDELVFI
jgi:CRP-like cAMP-binding protein